MKYGLFFLFSLLSFLSFSLRAEEGLLSQADYYFAHRSEKNNLKQGKKIYLKIIKSSSDMTEKIHAFDRYARLSVLEGQLAPFIWGTSAKSSPKVFERCIDLTNYFSKDAIGYDIPEYAYWRAICIGLWANNSSFFTLTLKYHLIIDMANLIKFGEREYPDFDEQGFALLKAGLNVRSQLLKVVNLYQPEQAIKIIDRMHEQNFANFTGYLLKAEALTNLRRKDEARKALQEGIEKLEDRIKAHELSPLLEIENLATLYLMNESLKNLSFSRYAPRPASLF